MPGLSQYSLTLMPLRSQASMRWCREKPGVARIVALPVQNPRHKFAAGSVRETSKPGSNKPHALNSVLTSSCRRQRVAALRNTVARQEMEDPILKVPASTRSLIRISTNRQAPRAADDGQKLTYGNAK